MSRGVLSSNDVFEPETKQRATWKGHRMPCAKALFASAKSLSMRPSLDVADE